MVKVTNAFLSADIPLYKQNDEQIKNQFYDIVCHLKLFVQKMCCNYAQLSHNRMLYMANLLVFDESTASGIPNLNILVGSLETSLVSYLCDCQPLPSTPK